MLSEEKDIFNLEVDEIVKNHMLETARWGKFLAIFWLIINGLGFIAGLSILLNIQRMADAGYQQLINTYITMGVTYLLAPLVSFYPAFAMLRYAVLIKRSIQHNNQAEFTTAFAFMKKGLKYLGILTVVTIVLITIGVVMTIVTLSRQGF